MSTVGGCAVFNCVPLSGQISQVQWALNGSSIEILNLTNVESQFSNIRDGIGSLLFRNLSVDMNNTLISCSATEDSEEEVCSTNKPTLLLQGMKNLCPSLSLGTGVC